MKYWTIDSIPIGSKEGLEMLGTRLNQLEENGFTIEGIELYGPDKFLCILISHRKRTEDDVNELILQEVDT